MTKSRDTDFRFYVPPNFALKNRAVIIMTPSKILLFVVAVYASTLPGTSKGAPANIDERLAVLENRRPPVELLYAFHTNEGKLRYKQYLKGQWSSW